MRRRYTDYESVRFYYGGLPEEVLPVTLKGSSIYLNGRKAVPLPARTSGWLAAVSPYKHGHPPKNPPISSPPPQLVDGAAISADESEYDLSGDGRNRRICGCKTLKTSGNDSDGFSSASCSEGALISDRNLCVLEKYKLRQKGNLCQNFVLFSVCVLTMYSVLCFVV